MRDWQLLNEVNHTFYWNVPGSDPSNIDNTGSAPGYVNLLRVDPAGDQVRRPPRADRLRGHRQQGLALPAGDLQRRRPAAVRRLRGAPVHRRAAQRDHDPALRAPRDEPPRRPAKVDVRDASGRGPRSRGQGRRPRPPQPHHPRPGARGHRDPAAACALAPAAAAEQRLLLQLALASRSGACASPTRDCARWTAGPRLRKPGAERLRALVAGLRGLPAQVSRSATRCLKRRR